MPINYYSQINLLLLPVYFNFERRVNKEGGNLEHSQVQIGIDKKSLNSVGFVRSFGSIWAKV